MPDVGDTLNTKIDHRDPFGNGIVEIENQIINIGPVSGGAGESVRITIVRPPFAYCHTETVKKTTYLEDFESILRGDFLADGNLKGVVATVEAKGHPDGLSQRPTVNFGDTEVEIRGANVGDVAKIKVRRHSGDTAVADVLSKRPNQSKGVHTINFIQNIDQSEIDHILRDLQLLDKFGEVFTSDIVDKDGSNIGYIEPISGYKLEVGPVSCDIGEEIKVRYIGNGYAKCLTDSVQEENYLNRFNILSGNTDSLPIDIGDVFTAEIIDTHADFSIAEYKSIHINLSTTDVEVGQFVKVEITGFASQSANGELLEKVESRKDGKTEEAPGTKETPPPAERNSKENPNVTQTSISNIESVNNLSELREEAEEDSSSDISTYSNQSSQSIQQYNRSQKVKEYVKARAEGVCEGCNEPAPFLSKTGEPYLHVHHIYELSDGGSDTPDTVIALCPNCHYRVHHGEDGQEYNRELLERVETLEQS